jgi:hypothetical protein
MKTEKVGGIRELFTAPDVPASSIRGDWVAQSVNRSWPKGGKGYADDTSV